MGLVAIDENVSKWKVAVNEISTTTLQKPKIDSRTFLLEKVSKQSVHDEYPLSSHPSCSLISTRNDLTIE